MNFPISVWSSYFRSLSPEDSVTELLAGGFDVAELSTEHSKVLLARGEPEKIGHALKAYTEDRGFSFLQGHLNADNDLCTDRTVDELRQELDLFAAIGIRAAVFHINGGRDLPEAEREARRVKSLRTLAEHTRGSGVTICLENLMSDSAVHSIDGILHIIGLTGCDNLGVCLDTGHLHKVAGCGLTTTSQLEFIRTAGPRLRALHVNDNIATNHDLHNLPFSSKKPLNWAEVMTGLREIGYTGLFNLEIPGENHSPLPIRRMKLDYIRKLCRYMMTDEFLTEFTVKA